MSNRVFYGVLVLILIGFSVSYLARPKPKHNDKLMGVVTHKSQGEQHIAEGATHVNYNSELPSSGPHYQDASAPAEWGAYTQELPPEIFLHNEEHGGVVVAYKPGLAQNQISKLQGLLAPPYADKNFNPGKAILTPRADNKYPIELASWTQTFNLSSFDQTKIEKFYFNNVSNKRAPESFAGPKNTPINEAVQ